MSRVQMAGTQRSGSNLLRLILGAHKGLFAPPSVHMYRVFRELGPGYGPLDDTANRRRIIDDVRGLIKLNVFDWPEGVPTRVEIGTRWADTSVEGLCCAVYDAAAARHGAMAWVCKSLENVRHLPELLDAIPGLLVLHLLRDGRDVAISFRGLPIGPKHPYVAAQEWVADQRAALAAERRLDQGRFVRVRYEDLTSAPAEAVARVCTLVGVPFDARALDFHVTREAQEAPQRSPLWQNLDRPVMAANIGKFSDPARRDFVQTFEATAFDVLVELGYEPIYADRPLTFSEEEIDGFLTEDVALRDEARRGADPATEALHRPQEDFVAQLRARLGVGPPLRRRCASRRTIRGTYENHS